MLQVTRPTQQTVLRGNIDFLLDEFYARQREFNDPLIARSRRIMELSQGESFYKRIVRSLAFSTMEVGERCSGKRRAAERKLARWRDEELGR